MKDRKNLSDAIETAIIESGATHYRIAKLAGITEASISRFMSGKSSLVLSKAQKLATALGLMLVPDPDVEPLKPTPTNRARPRLRRENRNRKGA